MSLISVSLVTNPKWTNWTGHTISTTPLHLCIKSYVTFLVSISGCSRYMTTPPKQKQSISYTHNTVEPTHAVNSIRQSPVLRGHICLVLSEIFI